MLSLYSFYAAVFKNPLHVLCFKLAKLMLAGREAHQEVAIAPVTACIWAFSVMGGLQMFVGKQSLENVNKLATATNYPFLFFFIAPLKCRALNTRKLQIVRTLLIILAHSNRQDVTA